MRPILADMQPVNDIARQGIAPRLLRDMVVKRGVGHDHVTDRGKQLAADLNDVSLGVVVKRRQGGDLADPAQGLVGHDLGLRKVPTTLDDTMADALDGVAVKPRRSEDLENELDGRSVIR